MAVSKGPDSLRFYVDGAHIGSKVLQGNPSAATSALTMLIGNDGPDPQPFQGNISQVRLWDFVRTQAEIQADLDYSIPGTTPGLVGYWEMNEGAGQTFADAAGTSPGTLGTTAAVEVADPEWDMNGCPIRIPAGKCMLFDGADDRVTLPNGVLNDIGTGSFTVEAWVRGTEADQATHPRILSNRDQIDNGFMFGFHGIWGGSAYKMLCMQLDGHNYILINNGTYNGRILDGTCHHVAVSKGPDSLRFYVDGAHIGSKVLQGNPSAATSALTMLIGNDEPDPQPFQGNISQVRLWDFVRTQAEIQADLEYSIPGSTPGLVGYWEMNEGVGQAIMDATNTSNGALGSVGSADVSDPTWTNDCC
ncbi:MAG: LamG domain-containing protein, partial [Flavobacteriales bacterium]|nr:LamG domain-containing protein [Flavobacteriales bacterium]